MDILADGERRAVLIGKAGAVVIVPVAMVAEHLDDLAAGTVRILAAYLKIYSGFPGG